jgi:hypothetical protein
MQNNESMKLYKSRGEIIITIIIITIIIIIIIIIIRSRYQMTDK